MGKKSIKLIFVFSFIQLVGLGIPVIGLKVLKFIFPKINTSIGGIIVVILLFFISILSYLFLCNFLNKLYGQRQKYMHYFGVGLLASFISSMIIVFTAFFLVELQSYLLYHTRIWRNFINNKVEILEIIGMLFVFSSIEFFIVMFFYEKFNPKSKTISLEQNTNNSLDSGFLE
jgi:hypothetical protein